MIEESKAAAESSVAAVDYTTKAELDAFEKTVQMEAPYLQLVCLQLGLSC